MIRRLDPRITATQSPLSAFSVLVFGQGFASQAEFDVQVRQPLWDRLVKTKPFERIEQPGPCKYATNFYADSCQELDLRIVQNLDALTIARENAGLLTEFLRTHTVAGPNGQRINANHVWPPSGRTGRTGGLVAAVIKGVIQGELYQLDASEGYPTPLVAVVSIGSDWPMLVIRAIAQNLAGLADEFVIDDDQHDSMPLGTPFPVPNVVALTADARHCGRRERAKLSRCLRR